MTNPTPNGDDNPCGQADSVPDVLVPGRAAWLRLCAATAAQDGDGIAQVLAELSCYHPSAWQTTLGTGAAEFVSLLVALCGGDIASVQARLDAEAMAAIDRAEQVTDRHGD